MNKILSLIFIIIFSGLLLLPYKIIENITSESRLMTYKQNYLYRLSNDFNNEIRSHLKITTQESEHIYNANIWFANIDNYYQDKFFISVNYFCLDTLKIKEEEIKNVILSVVKHDYLNKLDFGLSCKKIHFLKFEQWRN